MSGSARRRRTRRWLGDIRERRTAGGTEAELSTRISVLGVGGIGYRVSGISVRYRVVTNGWQRPPTTARPLRWVSERCPVCSGTTVRPPRRPAASESHPFTQFTQEFTQSESHPVRIPPLYTHRTVPIPPKDGSTERCWGGGGYKK